jgi:trehalose 6-phosphate phosphatase
VTGRIARETTAEGPREARITSAPLPALDFAADALLLDIDGTIIDIAPTPEAVFVPESLRLHLSHLRELLGGALALISGRTLAAIDELFLPLNFVAAGCHGAELRLKPDGSVSRPAPLLTTAERAQIAEIAKLDPRIRLEDKHYTMAIHYRLAPELENTLFGAVNGMLEKLPANLEVICGKDVIEIKLPGFDKGTGLKAIMREPPFAGRRPIFLGDDTTDEDAFAALPDFGGLGISVGRLLPGARGCVLSPRDVRHWLARTTERQR